MDRMKFFTNDLQRNIIKMVCLTIGLAIGFLLIAKVWFEQTYDTFFPDSDRMYLVKEIFVQGGKDQDFSMTPGAIAPGMKRYIPQVEEATRTRTTFSEGRIKLADGRKFDIEKGVLADERFFDVFPRQILAGDPHEVFAVEKHCMIPRSLAENIGGDVVGLTFTMQNFSDKFEFTIGGVYEDFPLNSTIANAVYVGMPTIALVAYDGRENWLGNDGYSSYIRLARGVKPADIQPAIRKMLEANIDREDLEVSGFGLQPVRLAGYYSSGPEIRTMSVMLTFLAAILLMSAGLNYLLITLGQMGRRTKEMAVRKCYGTSDARIFGRVMGESIFFLLVSVGLAVLLVACFPDLTRRLLGYTPAQLLSAGNVWIVEGAVCLLLLAVTGVVPAWLYCRTPVATAFRGVAAGQRGWKLVLLSVEFFASGLLLCLLVLVGRQYHMMTRLDMGFEYENMAQVKLWGVAQHGRQAIAAELRRMKNVEAVGSAYSGILDCGSGNNVWVDENRDNDINVTDRYDTEPEFFEAAGVRFLQGENFRERSDSTVNQVIVEERFIDVLEKLTGVRDSDIVGRRFHITEHMTPDGGNEYEICGVVANMRRNNKTELGVRAAVWFPTNEIQGCLYVRFDRLTPESMAEAQEIIDRMLPENEIYILPVRTDVELMTEPVKNFATSVMIVGVAILLIAMIGLVGYTADEARRRAREIAIRKVNGESVGDIVRLLSASILKVAVPSLLAGGATAIIVGRRWLSQFPEQVTLSPLWMGACLLVMLAILLGVVAVSSLGIARSNPVKHLGSE